MHRHATHPGIGEEETKLEILRCGVWGLGHVGIVCPGLRIMRAENGDIGRGWPMEVGRMGMDRKVAGDGC